MNTTIQHVTDTALWVATFRAQETARADALFRDPLAQKLVGTLGDEIAKKMPRSGIVAWSVVVRTCIIDAYIEQAVAQGIDTVLNLGAGLDTRPYRMNLPKTLRWIEVDFPGLIAEKSALLKAEEPRCQLERVALDLSNHSVRQEFLKKINSEAKKVLVLTEGVVLYLSNEDVAALANDLRAQSHFKLWVVEYFSPVLMKRMLKGRMQKKLKNAPLRFNPTNWESFYSEKGWAPGEIRYLTEEGERLNRPAPMAVVLKIFQLFLTRARAQKIRQMSGYALLEAK